MIDKSKTYRTRDGREVRIYATDGDTDGPIHGAILTRHGWKVTSWTSDGLWCLGAMDGSDLIEVKPRIKREVWVNVYPNDSVILDIAHKNKAEADFAATSGRIACVRLTIDVEEGEGL